MVDLENHIDPNVRFDKVTQARAVVMGGSIAGLAAAKVLSDHFEEVVLIERDSLPQVAEQRRGVPQGWHTHGLLGSGSDALEGLFPGLFQEALDAGAVCMDASRDTRRWFEGGELARFDSHFQGLCISRPLLEGLVRERVRRIGNVQVNDCRQVLGLISNPDNKRVLGVRTDEGALAAELVVDATGRGSHSPKWLEEMGYGKAREDRIEINLAYATRRFRRSPDHMNGALLGTIAPTPKDTRGGVIIAQEDDSWIVTLFAYCGTTVPKELDSFIEFARTLPASYIYDVISRAEPIGDGLATRFPASVRRRYETMQDFPEGYLVLGDAISSFNPAYGQGMSVAALQAVALQKVLSSGWEEAAGLEKAAPRFFSQVAKIVDTPWAIAAGSDLRFAGVIGQRTLATRLSNWYITKLQAGAARDRYLTSAFLKVASLMAHPGSLFKPGVMGRVLLHSLKAGH